MFGLALAMTAANGWARIPVRRPSLRLILFLMLAAGLYYVAGPAYYSFAVCSAIYEALAERRRLLGACCLLAAICMKLGLDTAFSRIGLVLYYCEAPPATGYDSRLLNWAVVLLYAYFPACAATVVYWPKVKSWTEKRFRRPLLAVPPGTTNGNAIWGWLRWLAGTALLLTAAAVASSCALDRDLKAALEIDYCAEHRLWTDVIAKAAELPLRLYSPCVNNDVNLALYHVGRLPYDMFAYPQMYLPLLTYQSVPRAALMRKPFDLLLELGRVNEAEHVALEMLEESPNGGTLKRLALVKLIKGQTAAAGVVLQVLRDDLVWGRWAEEYLHRVAADPTLAGDDGIQQTRRVMITEDEAPTNSKPSPSGANTALLVLLLLENSLQRNSGNRMAAEYLLATDLLLGDVPGVAAVLSRFDNAAYPTLPPLYEEALLIHGIEQPGELVASGSQISYRGRRISAATVDKFHRFRQIMGLYGGRSEEAQAVVAGELGNSYFYYYYFVRGRS